MYARGVTAAPIIVERDDTILTVTFYRHPSEAEHEAHLAQLSDIIEKGKVRQEYRWVVINNLKVVFQGSAMYRRRQADWMKDHEDELRHRTAGIGFVMDSQIMRGALTAVLWLAPLPCPHRIFATIGDAMLWAREHCRIPVDPRARPADRQTG